MMEHRKKGVFKQKIEASLYTLDCGFKKIPFTLYTYVLAKILQNGGKFRYTKAGSKNYRNLNNFRQALESPKSWNLMGFCPKNTFLQLKHYIQWIYLTLSNISTTRVKIHQITYVIFETISHFTIQLLCIFLAPILHTFYKSSPSKCKFSGFPLFTKFLMSFFK